MFFLCSLRWCFVVHTKKKQNTSPPELGYLPPQALGKKPPSRVDLSCLKNPTAPWRVEPSFSLKDIHRMGWIFGKTMHENSWYSFWFFIVHEDSWKIMIFFVILHCSWGVLKNYFGSWISKKHGNRILLIQNPSSLLPPFFFIIYGNGFFLVMIILYPKTQSFKHFTPWLSEKLRVKCDGDQWRLIKGHQKTGGS